jgi:flagellar protein FliS
LKRAEALRSRYLSEAVATATPAARLVMLFDALEMDLVLVDNAFGDGANIKVINDALIHAQSILLVLRDTLDTTVWEDGKQLIALYDHLHTELVHANIYKDRSRAATVAKHIGKLANAWRQAAATMDAPTAVETPTAP